MLPELKEPLHAYLNGPGFSRLWPKVKEKLEQLGRVGGRVTLSGMSPYEQKSIEGLLALNLHAKDSCTIDLKRLNTALVESRFEATLEECIHLLYPGTFVTRREERQSELARWEDFCEWAHSFVKHETMKNWVVALSFQSRSPQSSDFSTTTGYRTFRECYEEYCEFGDSISWRHASAAVNLLPQATSESVRLPVIAATATGDPHGLDRDRLAGRMFFRGLVALSQPEQLGNEYDDGRTLEASDGETVRALYRRFGILLDDISSFVFVANFPGVAELPIALPLIHVHQLSICENPGRVFVVENPSIFGTLAETAVIFSVENRTEKSIRDQPRDLTRNPISHSAKEKMTPCPLVCTSGQPSTAALHLLDKVTAAGGTILYSGDFDGAGLQMAASLAERYGERFVPWRMYAGDYLRVHHHGLPKLADGEFSRLQEMVIPWERGIPIEDSLLNAIEVRRVKVYQEHLMEQLKQDYVSYADIQ